MRGTNAGLGLAVMLALAGQGCGPPPVYDTSCDGVALLRCDQAGRCSASDCSADGRTCQVLSATEAACVAGPQPSCDASYLPHCVGDLLLYCDGPLDADAGTAVSSDCFDLYATYDGPGWCEDLGGGQAACQWGP